MKTIGWREFEAVDLRVGTILKAEVFPEARKPAYKIWIDFGPSIGIKKSSAQVTKRYSVDSLPGRQVVAVVNFAPKQIGPFLSECLITGFADEEGEVILAVPEQGVANGSKLL